MNMTRKEELGLFDLKYLYDELILKGELNVENLKNKLKHYDVNHIIVSVINVFNENKTLITIESYNFLEGFVKLKNVIIFNDEETNFVNEMLVNQNNVEQIIIHGKFKNKKEEDHNDNINHFFS